jgi:hypothetical protein
MIVHANACLHIVPHTVEIPTELLQRTNRDVSLSGQCALVGKLDSANGPQLQNQEQIQGECNELGILLQRDRPSCNDLILMVGDSSEQERAEQLLLEIDAEQRLAISNLHALELDGQKAQDIEAGQLREDVLHHLNSQTDDIVDEVDRSECSSVNVYNESSEWWVEPPDSDEEDYHDNGTNSDTDTEDGAEEHIGLIQANMQLIAFLKRQSITIARLRRRILRLRSRITELTFRLDNTTGQVDTIPLGDTPDDKASVLFTDAHADATFLVAPSCDPVVQMDHLYHPKIKKELEVQLARIQGNKNSKEELWMYFDSGASRSVISTTSPIRQHLQLIGPAYGSCSIGDGTPLNYLEKGSVKDNLEITVVDKLKYDLFSSVNAAKQGLTSIIEFDFDTEKNNSFTIDKFTGNITPLVERGKGILELPLLHLMLPAKACVSIAPDKETTQGALPPNVVSMFWHCYDDVRFDLSTRDNNKTDYSLFTFDIVKSLNPRERDFLIHARLTFAPHEDTSGD